MTFSKPMTAPNGASVQFHKIVRIESKGDLTHFTAVVASWPSEADYVAGKPPAWNSNETRVLDPAILATLGELVRSDGDFEGSVVLPDPSNTLQSAKARKLAYIEGRRDAAARAPLVTPYGTFDAHKAGRDNVADVHALLTLKAQRGLGDTTNFTRHDFSRSPITLAELGTVALMLGQQVQSTYDTADELRLATEAATTIEQLEQITWPT